MKRLIVVSFFLVIGIAVAYSQVPTETKENAVRPKDGYVPNAETAVKIAEAVLEPVYGKETLNQEKPLKAVQQGDVWRVAGTLPPYSKGGTAVVKISKFSGEILFMGHYK